MTEREAAEALGVSATYLRRLRKAGAVPVVLLPPSRGRRPTVRYAPEDLRAWIARRRAGRWRL
jgi:predicted site-specific integrase-resolvase